MIDLRARSVHVCFIGDRSRRGRSKDVGLEIYVRLKNVLGSSSRYVRVNIPH